ncbi:hypothetical protein H206_05281 [Candidatus Electrothrix aarhusensis]|uniref:Uncharacterized protein n=1 Tax=Candidatus Electrothrix aarhusensis TaxID=1859131 RepID=A0A3S3RAL5_9BACT|nr:hypothetical protein H206_05281 [Candidatus Electrothrix aarhusensis]
MSCSGDYLCFLGDWGDEEVERGTYWDSNL